MESDIDHQADFTGVRYAQCWEDADVLLAGLEVREGDTCVSIASAGDNVLSLLTRNPRRVIAVDLSPAQLSCLALRVAAYKSLEHAELLELVGSTPSGRRRSLYARCHRHLHESDRVFWDAHPRLIDEGIGSIGKFERYFALFRARVLPLVHPRRRVESLLAGGTPQHRREFYEHTWDSWRWRLMFRLFFSRFTMGRLGRDPAFFRYVEGSVADRILARARHALTELDPADNPYLQWILLGRHGTALPLALRRENFDAIRSNIDRVEWHRASLQAYLQSLPERSIDRWNLSDIFEYMSDETYRSLLELIVSRSRPGGRLAYWNMLVPRSRPAEMASRLAPLESLASRLHLQDKAFFYSRFVVEEVR